MRKKIAKEVLSTANENLSLGIINVMVDEKRKFAKNLPNTDYKEAMKLRIKGGTKALDLVREKYIPLPSPSTLNRKFSWIHLAPGFIAPVLLYFISIFPKLTTVEKIIVSTFDKMNTRNRADLEMKYEQLIGPAKNVQNFMVRSLFNKRKWKFPVWLDFDTGLPFYEYFQGICLLESIGLIYVCTTCDMGTLNIQLSIHLLITEDRIFHKNPYDESRIIIFIFDFIHCFKNLRNHILDDIMKFLDGSKLFKQFFLDLKKKLTDSINVAL